MPFTLPDSQASGWGGDDEDLDIQLDIEETKDLGATEEKISQNISPAVTHAEERGGWGEMDDDLILVCEEV